MGAAIMSTKSSQEEPPWPSTQQMLLDHLRRIVEGVACTDFGDPSKEMWTFGFGDCLVSWSGDWDDPQFGERSVRLAEIGLLLSRLNVESRDRPSGPTGSLKAAGTDQSDIIRSLAKIFSDRPLPHELFRRRLPENLGVGLEEAYAFEMLNKLDQVVDRSKQKAVQEILLLENVPEGVDDYMAEAAACFRYGFDKACLAVCRTALEESLRRRIESDYGRDHVQTYDRKLHRLVDKGLRTLIEDAHKKYGPKQPWEKPRATRGPTYLTDQMKNAADRIRRWGNGAVHGKSDIPRGVVESRARKALLYSKQLLRHLWSSV